MSDCCASLPMYDVDRDAVQAWWRCLARAMRAEGLAGVPSRVEWPQDLNAHWRDPTLLLSQACGYPLVTGLADAVEVVGAFRYAAPGCEGIDYRSELVAREQDASRGIEHFRGRVAAFNARGSHSGCNALRALVAPLADRGRFFSRAVRSGSHRESIALVRDGHADIAAVDCVSLALFRLHAPELLKGLRIVGSTAAAPGLPLVTSRRRPPDEVQALRRALIAACTEPAFDGQREALLIEGFEAAAAPCWDRIDLMRRAGEALVDFD
ncbi:PhnD/SsuA/transferrin family substrate-binding protein [Piscinibacter sp. XHJ-5]|uniref:phosphate/phosphite/phosphonate ABC transporter substrate-binding protein n=1 Tax=Piscinibacter sp. XHJ-5 TaxID=3037797 RepID=UPI0024534A05|nr:PhnD/SsuA/transferrin family substrate-binding protein [Piscinibacter sp. XHJ-5]